MSRTAVVSSILGTEFHDSQPAGTRQGREFEGRTGITANEEAVEISAQPAKATNFARFISAGYRSYNVELRNFDKLYSLCL
jgi:hypothetical protein